MKLLALLKRGRRAAIWSGLCLALTFLAAGVAPAAAQTSTSTTSTTQKVFIVSDTTSTNGPLTFSYTGHIVGKYLGATVYDQTVNAPTGGDPAVLAAITAARNAIIAAGGPSENIQQAQSSTQTTTLSTTITYSLVSTVLSVQTTLQIGPTTVQTGQRTVCSGVGALPGPTLPTCGPGSPTNSVVVAGSTNTNVNTDTEYDLNKLTATGRNTLTSELQIYTGTPPATNGISFAPLPTRSSGYASFTLFALASSGLPVAFASSTPAVCAVSGREVARVADAGGTCTIVASQPGNATVPAATPVSQSFLWSPATVGSITSSTSTSITQAVTTAAASVRNDSFSTQIIGTLNGATVYSQTFPAAYADPTAQAGVASARAAVAAAGGANVAIASSALTSHSETIVSSTPAISDVVQTSTQTGSLQLSIGPGTILVGDRGVCSFGGSPDNFPSGCSNPGVPVNVLNGASNINANINTAQQILRTTTTTNNILTTEVYVISGTTPGANVITFAALAARTIGSGPVTLNATASSGLAVSFASATPAICSVAGASVSLLAVGSCAIVAAQAGNASFPAATPVSQTFAITQAATSVALSASSPTLFLNAPVTFSASVSGAGPTGSVTFFDGAAALATVALSGTTASLTTSALAAGSHAITARYGGDANNAASVSPAVSVSVNGRPDPSRDPDVIGLVNAQVTAGRRFAESQIDNVNRRLEELHEEDQAPVSNNIAFSGGAPDPAGGAALGYAGVPAPQASGASAALDRYRSAFAAPPAKGPAGREVAQFSIWTGGSVNFGNQNYAAPFNGTALTKNRFTTSGVTAGIDTRVMDGLKVGLAVGFGADSTDIGSFGTRLTSRLPSASLYASWRFMPHTFLDVLAGYGRGSFNSSRWSAAGGLFVPGGRNASEFYGSLSLASEQKWGALKFAPYAQVQAIQMRFDAFAETGSPAWALAYNAFSVTDVSGVLGLRAAYGIDMGAWSLTPMTRLEYRHSFNGGYSQILNYADLAGTGAPGYTLTGRAQARDTLSGALGLRAENRSLLSASVEYQIGAAFSGGVQSQSLRASIKQGF